MKKTYLLFLLSCSMTLTFAQRKYDIGFVVKSGIYSLPFHWQRSLSYGGNSVTTIVAQKPGYASSFGIRQSFRLGARFSISSDLLYRHFSYSTKETVQWRNTGFANHSETLQKQQSSESSFSIPINLHVSLRKNGGTSLSFGIGMSRILRSETQGSYERWNTSVPIYDLRYKMPQLVDNMKDFKPELTISAGVAHRINENTSIGLEFSYERRSDDRRFVSAGQFDNGLVCDCYGYQFLEIPSLRSLAVSLSHVLSR